MNKLILMNKFKNVPTYTSKLVRGIGYTTYIACVVHCVMQYIGSFVVCVGPSMEPTIFSSDVVITENLSVRQQKISKGDIVVCKSPQDPHQYICKRVKAVSGDTVRHGFFAETEIPKGHVWLEGDNKSNSSDSRHYGPVPQGLVIGRVIFKIWPFNKFTKFSNYKEQST